MDALCARALKGSFTQSVLSGLPSAPLAPVQCQPVHLIGLFHTSGAAEQCALQYRTLWDSIAYKRNAQHPIMCLNGDLSPSTRPSLDLSTQHKAATIVQRSVNWP